jgi:hypothetical protein
MAAPASIQETTYTAIVHAADGVLFVASAHSRAQLTAQIVSYIRERCDYVLWPAVSDKVRALIDDDEPDAAITMYFARAGERWDEECLELGGLGAWGSGGLGATPSHGAWRSPS